MTAGVRRTPVNQDQGPDQTPFHRFIAGDVDADVRRAWSNRKRVPVYSPWRRRRFGQDASVELLTAFENHVLWVVQMRIYRGLGSTTVRSLEPLVGGSGPGRTWHALNRLRWRGLIGFHGTKGRYGRLDLWIPRAGREAIRRTLADHPGSPSIVSVATPFGGFLSREGRGGLADSWPKRYVDRLEEARGRRAPPGRTHRLPPMFLTARCPSRHSVRLKRAAFGISPRRLTGRWEAVCHHCRPGRWGVE